MVVEQIRYLKAVKRTVLNCTRRRRTADRHLGTAAFGLSEASLQSYIHILFYFECPQNPSYIGGTATAPVLAGAYSNALVPVGIMMALLGYVIGTGGGLVVANLMSIFG